MRSHVKPQHTVVFCGFIRYTPKRPTDLDNFEFHTQQLEFANASLQT